MIMSRMSIRFPEPGPAGLPALVGAHALRLPDLSLIRASGADAASFLQGQLTQDTLRLRPHEARLGAWCSAKGRMLASFVFWQPQADEVLLVCSADLLPGVLKRLSMFVLRAKCKLTDASGERPIWGLAGALPAPCEVWGRAVVEEGDVRGELIRLPDAAGVPRALWLGAKPPPAAPMDLPAWHALEAASAVVRIVAATAEQFVPQMVNLEAVGGVNFQKGCYPGQEVVARSQYRGTLKRRGAVVTSAAPLAAAQEVFHSADPGQPAGMVAVAGVLEGQAVAFVELKLAALQDGTLHAGSADGPLLTLRPLPYSLPPQDA
jgi:tRNA-modifying protein YgfZ